MYGLGLYLSQLRSSARGKQAKTPFSLDQLSSGIYIFSSMIFFRFSLIFPFFLRLSSFLHFPLLPYFFHFPSLLFLVSILVGRSCIRLRLHRHSILPHVAEE